MDTNCNRFFFAFFAGYYYFVDKIEDSIRPRYMETVEESLNDTAYLLVSLLESELFQKNVSLEKTSERVFSPILRISKEKN
ncbi:hypothetical protein LEP1GSC123_2987 [Leptospira borgpetersenii str. 200701203]|uniref:Uncharacterized protein n=1 Tax=Leptospira borgpetersenii str. 200701203 TaxID=1193007 RepID=M3GYK8_LEPBO|nr:hypothetical protein LEP1GSC123_2987 [Leptospira borgpetersenii str. 200701203]